MKLYQTLLDLTTEERNAELGKSYHRAVVLTDAKKELQKDVAKLFVAMIAAGDCQPGEMRKHGIKITGEDIRETLQDVYGLVNVFQAVVDGTIEISEEEFDKMDQSKLALLSPFLTKPELKDKLEDAVKAAKTGTAKDIRNLKPKAEKAAEPAAEKPQGTEIPVGFVATDIAPGEALVKSRQFRARLMADFTNAIETSDENTLTVMLELFGKAYYSACEALGDDPLDFIASIAASQAAPAEGTVVETPAAIGEAVAA